MSPRERYDLAQVPPDREIGSLPEPASGLAVEAGVQLDLTDAAAEVDVDAVQNAAEIADGDVSVANPAPAPASNGHSPAPQASSNGAATATAVKTSTKTDTGDMALAEAMGDAPVCSNCGHMTVRNGSCYVCLTCGDTTGCS